MQAILIIFTSVLLSTIINIFMVKKTSDKFISEVEKIINKYKNFIEKHLE